MKKLESLNYYDGFIKNAEYALEIANVLKDYMTHFKAEKAKEIEEKVHFIENEADKSQHEILNHLVKDFIPPIEREDIINLCHEIDTVVDNIDEIVINIDIYNITSLADDVNEYVELLNEITKTLVELVSNLKNVKKREIIKENVIKINNLEENGDKLFQKSIRTLYENPIDPVEVIKWTTIYNCFENCFDAIERVSDVVDEIVMKNS